jgi:hypothetical protein
MKWVGTGLGWFTCRVGILCVNLPRFAFFLLYWMRTALWGIVSQRRQYFLQFQLLISTELLDALE